MTIFDEISIIANKLANEGKKPTVALVKNKLSSPTPLPTIISALKSWKHDPEFIQDHKPTEQSNDTIAPSNADDTQQLIEIAIEQALKPIKQELAEIKALLKQVQK